METAILMATYNGEKYIEEQLMSIINQTYQDWILYIRDDGSKDKTKEIIKKYKLLYPDKIKTVERGNSIGGSKYNFWELCKFTADKNHKYIMFSDQDDFWNKDKIEKTLNAMKQAEKQNGNIPILVHSDLEVVDKDLNHLGDSFIKDGALNPKCIGIEKLIVQNNVTGCATMINKALLDKSLKLNSMDNIVMHDWWLALVAASFGKIIFIEDATIKYRQHGDNVVGAVKVKSIRFIIDSIAKRFNKNKIRTTVKQAKVLLKTYNDFDKKTYDLIYKFANLPKYNKFKRMYIAIKYGFVHQGFVKCIGGLILI